MVSMVYARRCQLPQQGLRCFSKVTCWATLFLIFVGSLVTSTGSGLAVPDWPLSYGTLFPPMVGGVFYEHGHRMVASTVGFLMLVLAFWMGWRDSRRWVKILGFLALGTVIIQGILGGLTVLFFLPTPVSVSHAVLAQTFFVLTIIIAYSQSREWHERLHRAQSRDSEAKRAQKAVFWKMSLFVCVVIYVQLILGAVMRHTASGLAIPDFPLMGGAVIPAFNEAMLARINDMRFEMLLDPVNRAQVMIHSFHRVGAVAVTLVLLYAAHKAVKLYRDQVKVMRVLQLLALLLIVQIVLGALTVWTEKAPYLTSCHVLTGAAMLGVSVLLSLRTYPLKRMTSE